MTCEKSVQENVNTAKCLLLLKKLIAPTSRLASLLRHTILHPIMRPNMQLESSIINALTLQVVREYQVLKACAIGFITQGSHRSTLEGLLYLVNRHQLMHWWKRSRSGYVHVNQCIKLILWGTNLDCDHPLHQRLLRVFISICGNTLRQKEITQK